MSGNLDIKVALSHPAIPAKSYSEDTLFALIDITPQSSQSFGGNRPPLNLVLVVDASATMHHFQLTEDEGEYWRGLAIARDEMERGEADESEAIYWTGQTLAEMQSVARKPMALAVEAIKSILLTLLPLDRVSVIAFADRVHPIFTAEDWDNLRDHSLMQLDLLREQRLSTDIGTGTYMAEALRSGMSLLSQQSEANTVNRLIVISDGIVQDADNTMEAVEALQNAGYAITTVGVGDEFDEEFLTRIADNSRGEYYYAADIAEITDRLHQEMATLESTTATEMYIAVRGLEGAVVQDISQVRPTMALFDEVYTEDDWTRARIGDVSSNTPAGILIQIAPALLPEGTHAIAEAQFTWLQSGEASTMSTGTEKATISVNVTDDASQLADTNQSVQNLVDRFEVYKLEREAQRAQERGDLERAREKLGAATRELHKIGEESLAHDVELQIASLGQASTDPNRVKRIKATTRRLGAAPSEITTAE